MMWYRYSRWDGTQRVFEPTGEELMDELADDVLAHGDLTRALRDLMQRGMEGRSGERMAGLREMMERLRQNRQERLEQYNLDSLMDDIKERLQDIVATERQGIDQRLEEARQQAAQAAPAREQDPEQLQHLLDYLQQRAERNREQLDNLPESPGGQIQELSSYDFMDPEAQRKFQELLDQLKQQMLQNSLKDLKQQLQGLGPQDMQGLRQMLKDLNQMLQERMQGLEPDFQGFMDQYGSLFGPNPPQNLDELLEQLAQQIAQTQSLLNSLSPKQRQELEELLDSVLDPETRRELAELAAAMQQLMPLDDLINQYPFMGEEDLTMDQAMELMGQLQNLDQLEKQLQEISRKGNIEDLDLDKVEELLGDEARRNVEELQRLTRMLEEAGYLRRKGSRLELTPSGIRRIAQRALRDLFAQLKKDRMGQHDQQRRGVGGEHLGETKVYEFGDPFEVNLQETVLSGVTRSGPGTPVHLLPEDFHVYRTEHLTETATVLLLDQSRSMGLYGSFVAAKKVALALYALIQSKFPRDRFYVVGFSDYAVELKGEDLPGVSWNAWVSGTNMHHALMLSRKLLADSKSGTRQIIMITDGEPTAHLEHGRSFFSYPPSYRTLEETLKEVKRCTQERIIINTFMLEASPDLLDFVDKMTRINRGRAFYTTPQKLGEYVLVDYFSNRRSRIRA